MGKFFSNFSSGLTIGLGFFTMLLIGGTIYASVNNIWTTPNELEVTSGSNLTSENWNKILSNQNYLSGRIDGGLVMPRGGVMAFNLDTCPEGWSEANGVDNALDLRGEFIRGLDKGRGLDPDTRILASTQEDTFQGHQHGTGLMDPARGYPKSNVGSQAYSANPIGVSGGANNKIYNVYLDVGNGIPRTSSETRPHNVALLYCVKN